MMNNLMGIKCDRDVMNLTGPSFDAVMEYEVDSSKGPVLKPMKPYFTAKLMQFEWNQRLAELFTGKFQDEHNLELTPEDECELHEMFEDRLMRLRRQLVSTGIRAGESEDDCRDRILAQHKAVLARKRPNTRRSQVRQNSINIDMSLTKVAVVYNEERDHAGKQGSSRRHHR
jgi:hypothetical protein